MRNVLSVLVLKVQNSHFIFYAPLITITRTRISNFVYSLPSLESEPREYDEISLFQIPNMHQYHVGTRVSESRANVSPSNLTYTLLV